MHNIPDDCANHPGAPWNEPAAAELESPFWLLENSPSEYTREEAAQHIFDHAMTWLDVETVTDLLAWAVANQAALPDAIRKPIKVWAKSCVEDSEVKEIESHD